MSKEQSEAVLEYNMITSLVDLGYKQITINNEEELELSFRNQINFHNDSRLNNKTLSDREFEQLLISLSGKGVFNSDDNLR